MKLDVQLNVVEVHVHVHQADSSLLEELLSRVKNLQKKDVIIMATLEELETQVEANTDAEQSAIVLIEGIVAELEAAKNDPVRLQAAIDNLRGSGDALAAAVVANTDAESEV